MATGGGHDTEEAGTDEVAALAALFAAPRRPHREDADDEEQSLVLAHDDIGDESAVLPRQHDEFTCRRCFLVMHVSRRVGDICLDCA